jgi:hypothetical protein
MRTLEQTRKYECLVDGEWVPVHWEQLEEGDVVRSNYTVDGPMVEEYVLSKQPALEVDVLKSFDGRVTKLEDYEFTGVCDIGYVAVVHETTVQFIKHVNPEITNWDRAVLRGIIRVPVPVWRGGGLTKLEVIET